MERRLRFCLAACLWALSGCGEDEGSGAAMDAEADARAIGDARANGDASGTPDASPLPDAADAPDARLDHGDASDAARPPQCSDGIDNDGDGRIDFPDDPGCDSPEDDDESSPARPVPQCGDARDNDADGLIDLDDPDCVSGNDPTEDGREPLTVCSDLVDNDGDGLIDFPQDPGCAAAGDDDERDPAVPRACGNGRDDDGDGIIDYPLDPGCQGPGDADERDPPTRPECADGQDNDGDGLVDYPADPGCHAAGDFSETSTCGAGRPIIDLRAAIEANGHYDGDLADGTGGLLGSCGGGAGPEVVFFWRVTQPIAALTFTTDHPETEAPTVIYVRRDCGRPADLACNRGTPGAPGTTVRLIDPAPGLYFVVVDTSSRDLGPGRFRLSTSDSAAPQCRDEIDNDGDGLIDLFDPGCEDPDDDDETTPVVLPECADGIDNDNDGFIDYPADRDCLAAGHPFEGPLCPAAFVPAIVVRGEGGTFPLRFGEESATTGSCGGAGSEAALAIIIRQPSDLTVTVASAAGQEPAAAIYLREACADAATEQGCVGDARRPLVARELPPGMYFVIVDRLADGPDLGLVADVQIESLLAECNDGVDNDGDGRVDLDDPGCQTLRGRSEATPARRPACLDRVDNDADGHIDYPADPGCVAAGDLSEQASCQRAQDVITVVQESRVIAVDLNRNADVYQTRCGSGPEQVVELILTAPSAVRAATSDSDFDPTLEMRRTCDEAASVVDCNDDGGPGLESLLNYPRLEPGSYFFLVQGFRVPGVTTLTLTVTPFDVPQCADNIDNDGDGLFDLEDPGCTSPFDDDETSPAELPECADGIDNDGDGLIDWPADPACAAAGGASETLFCLAAVDLVLAGDGGEFAVHPADGQGHLVASCSAGSGVETVLVVNTEAPGDLEVEIYEGETLARAVVSVRGTCDEAGTELACGRQTGKLRLRDLPAGRWFLVVERRPGLPRPPEPWRVVVRATPRVAACANGLDDDGDGLIDLADPGCLGPHDEDESSPPFAPQCRNGVDDDGDGLADYPEDPGCAAAGGTSEAQRCEGAMVIDLDAPLTVRIDPGPNAGPGRLVGTCGNGRDGEVVLAVHLAERSDLTVTVSTAEALPATVFLYLRTECGDAGTEFDCRRPGQGGVIEGTGLPAGTYYVVVERSVAAAMGELHADVRFAPRPLVCEGEGAEPEHPDCATPADAGPTVDAGADAGAP